MQMIIANTLAEGQVVFMTAAGGWTPVIEQGAVANSDDDAAALFAMAKQAEKDNRVIDPCLIPVSLSAGVLQPTDYREFIRARGPSIPIPGAPGGQN